MCRVLELSPSGYYAWVRRGLSARARRGAQLTERIKGIWSANREVYGRLRIHAELQADGERIGDPRRPTRSLASTRLTCRLRLPRTRGLNYRGSVGRNHAVPAILLATGQAVPFTLLDEPIRRLLCKP